MKFLHLSVTFAANISSSDSPACASSSCGRYTLPLLALYQKQPHHKNYAYIFTIYSICYKD
ncbi:hypothetical protein Hanom_Chr07g00640551 [Helianthus anomalus]